MKPASRYLVGLALLLLVAANLMRPAYAGTPVLRVAYAGSMGVIMDRALGPDFARKHHATYQGFGRGSYGLAHLLAARQMRADVFVAITSGPIRALQKAGLVAAAMPVASTQMAIAYSRKSRFADAFRAAARGGESWYRVLEQKGLRFGRTDPSVDPQGRNTLLMLKLAAHYYRRPGLLEAIAGTLQNPRQILSETSLLSRLEAGQIDATAGYLSAIRSRHLPAITLPDAINLGNPAMQKRWYDHVSILFANGRIARVQPLVFYAAVLKNARRPKLARAFITYLRSTAGQTLFARYDYGPPKGGILEIPRNKPG